MKRIAILLSCFIFSLSIFAQASGGQIRRSPKKQTTKIDGKSAAPTKSNINRKNRGQNISSQTQSVEQTVPLNTLSKYNIVTGTFGNYYNAQIHADTAKNKGYSPCICLYNGNYSVIVISADTESTIMLYADNVISKFSYFSVLYVENGLVQKFDGTDWLRNAARQGNEKAMEILIRYNIPNR